MLAFWVMATNSVGWQKRIYTWEKKLPSPLFGWHTTQFWKYIIYQRSHFNTCLRDGRYVIICPSTCWKYLQLTNLILINVCDTTDICCIFGGRTMYVSPDGHNFISHIIYTVIPQMKQLTGWSNNGCLGYTICQYKSVKPLRKINTRCNFIVYGNMVHIVNNE